MASGNRKRHACGHRNFGKFCHRCEFADKLVALAEAGKRFVDHPKNRKEPRKWTLEDMREEAKRLHSDDRK